MPYAVRRGLSSYEIQNCFDEAPEKIGKLMETTNRVNMWLEVVSSYMNKVYENMRAYSLDTKNEFKPNQFYNKDLNGGFPWIKQFFKFYKRLQTICAITFANIRTPQMKKVIVTGSETEGSVRWTR